MSKQNEKKTREPRQSPARIIRNNAVLFFKVCRFTPEYVMAHFLVEGIVVGFANSLDAVFTLKLFNALDRGDGFAIVARIIMWYALFKIAHIALSRAYHRVVKPICHYRINHKLHVELFEKTREIDVCCYDDPEFYNDFVWAMDEAAARAKKVIEDVAILVSRTITLVTIIGTLIAEKIDTVVIVVILTMSVIGCVVNYIGTKVRYEHQKEGKPLFRKRGYINRVYHLPDYAKEIRLSRADDLLLREADENNDDIVKLQRKYGLKYFLLYGLFYSFAMQAVQLGIVVYMFFRLLEGAMPVGLFAATVGLIWRVNGSINSFTETLMKFAEHSLYLEKYYGFLNYKPKVVGGGKEVPEFESLELKDVTFSYDFSSNPKYQWHKSDHKKPEGDNVGSGDALKGIDLKISRGEKIAIVGYNGAGKTTLIKLLMRLYDPTSGEILYNGRNVTEYDLPAYREKIGCVFQDFKIFSTTIAENVMSGAYDEERDAQKVARSLDAVGFGEKLGTLELGTKTLLTREFDKSGTNLSGGESQKVAIARVFARPYELWIMDEPSSALDPVAEYELNNSILQYAEGKTVIFISHRLSTTRMADRIYMFDSGRLIEVGSHDELMDRGGKYAQMFRLQAEKYLDA